MSPCESFFVSRSERSRSPIIMALVPVINIVCPKIGTKCGSEFSFDLAFGRTGLEPAPILAPLTTRQRAEHKTQGQMAGLEKLSDETEIGRKAETRRPYSRAMIMSRENAQLSLLGSEYTSLK